MSRRRSSVAASIVAAALLLCPSGPAGFTSVVLSLNGPVLKPGTVGAFLIRDEESVALAFEDEAQAQYPMEITAEASGL